jgi:hypothetical protein
MPCLGAPASDAYILRRPTAERGGGTELGWGLAQGGNTKAVTESGPRDRLQIRIPSARCEREGSSARFRTWNRKSVYPTDEGGSQARITTHR